MTNVRWITSSAASALHVAAALAEGRTIVDPRLAQALADPTAALAATLQEGQIYARRFFNYAIALACQVDEVDAKELGRLAAIRAAEREITSQELAPLARAMARVFEAQQRVIPDLARQLELRQALLAEQWEARGPGLLAAIGRVTGGAKLPKHVHVAVVYPALGGGGAASSVHKLVQIEGVLANPCPAIPEVVRLGWLIAQSKIGPPLSSLHRRFAHIERLAALALAPAALAAAEYVELARFDMSTLQLAIDVWGLADTSRPDLGELLYAWWNNRAQWNLSLMTLDGNLRTRLC